jgi:antitoxin (DNA-binding transcriptional repressor) of toxin-antitoxin stability system
MPTHFIGMKELRQNMSKITKQAKKKNERLIILRKNEPVFELKPLSKEDIVIETFRQDIEEALRDEKAGRVHNQKDIERLLGL